PNEHGWDSPRSRHLGKLRRTAADLVPRRLVRDLNVIRRFELQILEDPRVRVVRGAAARVEARSTAAAEEPGAKAFGLVAREQLLALRDLELLGVGDDERCARSAGPPSAACAVTFAHLVARTKLVGRLHLKLDPPAEASTVNDIPHRDFLSCPPRALPIGGAYAI